MRGSPGGEVMLMAELKWVKLATDIFDNEKILFITENPHSDSIVLIWIKLLCLAGKQNNGGTFRLSNGRGYTPEMFATLMRQPVKLIREAFCLFENYGMITVEDKTVFITNWDKYQNIDALDRIREQNRARKRRQREREVKK